MNINLLCVYPNNSGFMQNRNRMTKETITREHKDLHGSAFGLRPQAASRRKFH